LTIWLKQLQNEVIDLFFPRSCLGCGEVGDFICLRCSKKLPRLLPPVCQRCGRPESGGMFCRECWGTHNQINSIRSVFVFEGTIRRSVHEFKYRNLRSIAACLAKFMAEYFVEYGLSADVLMPVPMHENRLKKRGYNQSQLLAGKLAEMISVPVRGDMLKRVVDNKPQARTASVDERRCNMKDAFTCLSGEVSGQDIIVIDDVCTSGATLEACAAALKLKGANVITGFTLAREV
jgi:competence protein ComFC